MPPRVRAKPPAAPVAKAKPKAKVKAKPKAKAAPPAKASVAARRNAADLPGPPGPAVSEAEFQAAVISMAEACGWVVWWTPNSIGTNRGEPDLRMVRPPKFLMVELKTEIGRVLPAQKAAAELLQECPGVSYHCWRPRDWATIRKALR